MRWVGAEEVSTPWTIRWFEGAHRAAHLGHRIRPQPIGQSWSGLRGDTPVMNVGTLPVSVEDHDELGRAVDGHEGVGRHGGELGRLAGLDSDLAIPQPQAHPSLGDEKPIVTWVDPLLRWLGVGSSRIFTAIVVPVGRLSTQVVRSPDLFGVGRMTTSSSVRTSSSSSRST